MEFLATISEKKDGIYGDEMAFDTLEAAKAWVNANDGWVTTEIGKQAAHYYEIHQGDYIYDGEVDHFVGGGRVVEEGEL